MNLIIRGLLARFYLKPNQNHRLMPDFIKKKRQDETITTANCIVSHLYFKSEVYEDLSCFTFFFAVFFLSVVGTNKMIYCLI